MGWARSKWEDVSSFALKKGRFKQWRRLGTLNGVGVNELWLLFFYFYLTRGKDWIFSHWDRSSGSAWWCTLEFPILGFGLEIQSIRSFKELLSLSACAKEGKTHFFDVKFLLWKCTFTCPFSTWAKSKTWNNKIFWITKSSQGFSNQLWTIIGCWLHRWRIAPRCPTSYPTLSSDLRPPSARHKPDPSLPLKWALPSLWITLLVDNPGSLANSLLVINLTRTVVEPALKHLPRTLVELNISRWESKEKMLCCYLNWSNKNPSPADPLMRTWSLIVLLVDRSWCDPKAHI